MPITFAHPAAILPMARLRRESGWLGGLVAGSVVPDLVQVGYGYLNRFPHTVLGMISVDVPIAVAFAWLVHKTMFPRLRRLPGLGTMPLETGFSWFWALLGALIGGATHIWWDPFTHTESELAKSGFLTKSIAGSDWYRFTIADLLWYISSVLGTVSFISWLAIGFRRQCGSFNLILSWKWLILGAAIILPYAPVLRVLRYLIMNTTFIELLATVKYLSEGMKISIIASCIIGLTTFFLVTIEVREINNTFGDKSLPPIK